MNLSCFTRRLLALQPAQKIISRIIGITAPLRLQRLKKKLGSAERLNGQRAQLRALLSRRPVRVAFQVAHLGKWKCESVLQLMMRNPQFEPSVWIVPAGGSRKCKAAQTFSQESAGIRAHFEGYGIPVADYPFIDAFPADKRPDIVFIHEPYDYIFGRESYKGLTETMLCHVPYCFHNTTDALEFNGIGNNAALFNFYENDSISKLSASLACNKGRNNAVSGCPLADVFMHEGKNTAPAWKDCGAQMKKVIWAPHWTITEETCWFVSGTFLKNAEAMTELAEQYADRIQFAFKPHPHLYLQLCKHPDWGKEKTDAFYRRWAEMPNTQLAEGDYVGLFMQSDAMVHDSGSFILEYLFADKPAMFLREGAGYGDYNDMTLDALKSYIKGLVKADIEDFLQRCVLGTEDPLAATRRVMREKYLLPPNGKTAAENIVNSLKTA